MPIIFQKYPVPLFLYPPGPNPQKISVQNYTERLGGLHKTFYLNMCI